MEVRPVLDVAYADHIDALVRQTFARTGGRPPDLEWRHIIESSALKPSLSRISGMFDTRATGPQSLVSFAWGTARGSYATYEAGAAMRRKDLGSLSLGSAPLWDLVIWARQHSALWFDFGGVTAGRSATANDPVGGISSFKRSFCDNVVDVGEEWVLHPNPLRTSIVDLLKATARLGRPGNRSA
jgi:hypothetical protein